MSVRAVSKVRGLGSLVLTVIFFAACSSSPPGRPDGGSGGSAGGGGTSAGSSGTGGATGGAGPGSAGAGGSSGGSGAAGTVGGAGAGGKAGQAGSAGASGSAGTTGSAGASGGAGKVGSAGASGSAGSAGSTGVSGNAGTTGSAGSGGPPTDASTADATLAPNCPATFDASKLSDGLVSWWQAEGNANDSVGSNNGVLQNGVTFVTGPFGGQAFEFNGSTQDVLVPTSTTLNLAKDFTFAFWTKILAFPSSGAYLMGKIVSNVEDKAVFLNPTGIVQVILAGTGVNFYAATPLTLNVWHHVAATYDGANASLYIDGLFDANVVTSGTISNSSGALSFAHNATGGGGFIKGDLDELRWYSRALSAPEIAALHGGCN